MEQGSARFRKMAENSAGVRRLGATVLDLAYVACGRLDGFCGVGLKPWDLAAGSLLVLEAGGLVADFDGEQGWMDSGNVLAASPKIFTQMLAGLNPSASIDPAGLSTGPNPAGPGRRRAVNHARSPRLRAIFGILQRYVGKGGRQRRAGFLGTMARYAHAGGTDGVDDSDGVDGRTASLRARLTAIEVPVGLANVVSSPSWPMSFPPRSATARACSAWA